MAAGAGHGVGPSDVSLLERAARAEHRRSLAWITAIGNTAANRRLTFGIRGREHVLRHHTRGAAVFVLTFALSNRALTVLHGIDAAPPRALELAVLVIGSLLATVTRFVALRTWVFARRHRSLHPTPHTAIEGDHS